MKLKTISLFALGALFAAGAVQAYRNKDAAAAIRERDKKPTTISVAELAANGPGPARYVSLTDYEFQRDDIVIRKWKKANGFFGASILLLPKGQPPQPGKPRVVVMIDANSDADIHRYLQKTGSITGCITNDYINEVAQPVEREVEGKQFGPCYFISEGERPTLPASSDAVIIGLAVLALGCLGYGAISMDGNAKPKHRDFTFHSPAAEAPKRGGVELSTAALFPKRAKDA